MPKCCTPELGLGLWTHKIVTFNSKSERFNLMRAGVPRQDTQVLEPVAKCKSQLCHQGKCLHLSGPLVSHL